MATLEEMQKLFEAEKKKVVGLQKSLEESSGANTTKLAELTAKLEEAQNSMADPEYLRYLMEQGGGGTKDDEEESDYDELTQSQLAERMQQTFEESMKSGLKEATAGVDKLSKEVGRALAHLDIELAKVKDPEFKAGFTKKDYKARFFELSKQNPSWTTDDLRKQLKMESAFEALEAGKKKEAAEAEELKVMSESSDTASALLEEKKLSPEQAADLAFRQAFGTVSKAEDV